MGEVKVKGADIKKGDVIKLRPTGDVHEVIEVFKYNLQLRQSSTGRIHIKKIMDKYTRISE